MANLLSPYKNFYIKKRPPDCNTNGNSLVNNYIIHKITIFVYLKNKSQTISTTKKKG